jgi:hypothetical protein
MHIQPPIRLEICLRSVSTPRNKARGNARKLETVEPTRLSDHGPSPVRSPSLGQGWPAHWSRLKILRFTVRVNAPQRCECKKHNQLDRRANGSLVGLVVQNVPYAARPTITRLPPTSQCDRVARRQARPRASAGQAARRPYALIRRNRLDGPQHRPAMLPCRSSGRGSPARGPAVCVIHHRVTTFA